jgi:WD40 repeat protein/tRNA A-37 threonylcarbamoyl transferase component Bud32
LVSRFSLRQRHCRAKSSSFDECETKKIEDFFDEALKFNPDQRAAFVAGACAGDKDLQQQLEALLQSDAEASGFLPEQPLDSQTTSSPIIEKAGDQIGRYKLLQKLGEGGCGVVYMAEQEEPVRRRVALKVIKLGMDTKSVVARFEAERQALAMMDHSNIAKVLDAGASETGRPYFVMELVRGIKITEYCDKNNLSTRDRLDLFIQVCQAIQHAHQKGIIHRDIKPSNILVTLHDGVPVPKVIDFGIGKATEGRLTDSTLFTAFEQFIGTPAYMSPEQAEMSGLDIDTRSDIYSLGVLLYELLTGKTPFDAKELLASGLDEMRRTIREKEPARPSTRLSTMLEGELTFTAKQRQSDAPKLIHLLRGDLDWIVMKALEKYRTRRYETANGLAADLKRHLQNEPVVARPPSTAYRFQKLMRRNKLAFAAAAAIAVILILGIVTSTWQAVRATSAKRDAVKAQKNASEQRRDALEARDTLRRNLYASEMNIAYQGWQAGDAERPRALLTNQIPRTGEKDLRGWEWRYLWGRSRAHELKTLELGGGHVCGLASTPDGKIFAAHVDGTPLQLWDAESLQPLGTLSSDLSPNSDGFVVAFSPDGNRLLSTHYDARTVQLWNWRERRLLGRFTNHHEKVMTAVFTTDGQAVISTGGELFTTNRMGELKLWDASTFRELANFEPINFPVYRCDVSSDGRLVAAAGATPVVQVWDFRTRTLVARLAGHDRKSVGGVHLRFSPDGQLLATADTGGTVRLWNMGTNRNDWLHNEPVVLGSHGAPIYSLVFSADGQRLASCSRDHIARVWDIPNRKELAVLRGHAARVHYAAFIRDGKALATGGGDGKVRVWEMDSPSEDNVFARRARTGPTGFSADGRFLASGDGEDVAIWDLANTTVTHRIKGGSFAFSTNTIAVISPEMRLQMWSLDLDSLTQIADPCDAAAETNQWSAPAFSPRGDRFAAIARGDIHIWSVSGWKKLREIHAKPYRGVLFLPDGESVLAVEGESGITRWWQIGTGQCLGTFGSPSEAEPSISPDERFLATADDDVLRLWNVATGREIVPRFKTGLGQILSLAFSADGKTVAVGTFDGPILLWNVASGEQAGTLKGHVQYVGSLAFSPDGSTLVSNSWDNTIRLWKAPTWPQIDSGNFPR